MFHCSMEECGSAAAKYFVYRYIGCIIDQSNWSGPFSLVVMMPDFHPGDRALRPALAGCFNLRFIFLLLLHTDCFKYPSMSQILESRITKFRLFRLYRASMTCE